MCVACGGAIIASFADRFSSSLLLEASWHDNRAVDELNSHGRFRDGESVGQGCDLVDHLVQVPQVNSCLRAAPSPASAQENRGP